MLHSLCRGSAAIEQFSDGILPVQGYELVQGALVRWTKHSPDSRPPPTAVLVHGILGNRRNMVSFAHCIVEVGRSPFCVSIELAFWGLHLVRSKGCPGVCQKRHLPEQLHG